MNMNQENAYEPAASIRFFSSSKWGLWSLVLKATLPFLQINALESPQLAKKILVGDNKHDETVVPLDSSPFVIVGVWRNNVSSSKKPSLITSRIVASSCLSLS